MLELSPVPTRAHDLFMMLGVTVAVVVFVTELRRRGEHDPRLWSIAVGSLLGGALFARLGGTWSYLQRAEDPSLAGLWLYGGKTVLGGLAGAYLGAIATKRLLRYQRSTGDLFAPAVALGIAVGRIGCLLTEQPGTVTSLPWGLRVSAQAASRIPDCAPCTTGAAMHPSFLYEMVFLLVLSVILLRLRGRIPVEGELFKLFLLAYGMFRFFVEFVRGNATFAFGLSGPQIFLLATLPLLFVYFARQAGRGAYARPRAKEVAT